MGAVRVVGGPGAGSCVYDAERANTANITKLIETGESVLATERLAWIAAARKNDEAAADDDKGQARDAPGDPSTQGRRSKVAPE